MTPINQMMKDIDTAKKLYLDEKIEEPKFILLIAEAERKYLTAKRREKQHI